MSDAVAVAIVTNATVIIVAVVNRWLSHLEHRKTEAKVIDTNDKVTTIINNGKS